MNKIYGLSDSVINKINTVFKRYPQITEVILYGSRAIGNYRAGSDIDLCIRSEQLSLTELLAIESQLDDLLLPWKIDLSLLTHIDNPDLLAHINGIGVHFYP